MKCVRRQMLGLVTGCHNNEPFDLAPDEISYKLTFAAEILASIAEKNATTRGPSDLFDSLSKIAIIRVSEICNGHAYQATAMTRAHASCNLVAFVAELSYSEMHTFLHFWTNIKTAVKGTRYGHRTHARELRDFFDCWLSHRTHFDFVERLSSSLRISGNASVRYQHLRSSIDATG